MNIKRAAPPAESKKQMLSSRGKNHENKIMYLMKKRKASLQNITMNVKQQTAMQISPEKKGRKQTKKDLNKLCQTIEEMYLG